jgi:hypothetical protein
MAGLSAPAYVCDGAMTCTNSTPSVPQEEGEGGGEVACHSGAKGQQEAHAEELLYQPLDSEESAEGEEYDDVGAGRGVVDMLVGIP